jgi:hypothetical protein
MPVRLPLVDLTARLGDQVRIAEVGLECAIVGAEGACTAHPGQSDDVMVVRDAEDECFHLALLLFNGLRRDLPGPAGPPKLQKKILGAAEPCQFFGKASANDQESIPLEPVKKGAELSLDRLAKNVARQIRIENHTHGSSSKEPSALFQEKVPVPWRGVLDIAEIVDGERMDSDLSAISFKVEDRNVLWTKIVLMVPDIHTNSINKVVTMGLDQEAFLLLLRENRKERS